MKLTDFSIKEITETAKRDELVAAMKRERPSFVQTDERAWMASFKIDGLQRVAAVRAGHEGNVADDILQLDMSLRVNEEEFDNDKLIPESNAWEILDLISPEVTKRLTT